MSEGTVKWFGNSWGAPACEPEDHTETPVGKSCLACERPIEPLDQGLTMPGFESDWKPFLAVYHLDCYLKKILPHGPDCVHCRGRARSQHKMSCRYAKQGLDCDCYVTWKTEAP